MPLALIEGVFGNCVGAWWWWWWWWWKWAALGRRRARFIVGFGAGAGWGRFSCFSIGPVGSKYRIGKDWELARGLFGLFWGGGRGGAVGVETATAEHLETPPKTCWMLISARSFIFEDDSDLLFSLETTRSAASGQCAMFACTIVY